MNYDRDQTSRSSSRRSGGGYDSQSNSGGGYGRDNGYRDEIYSLRIPAGKRTYFFDVKSTRSGDDFFVTITESKRIDEGRYEKHKIFLYKEDFGKFIRAMHDVVAHIRDECLPEHDFSDLPELTGLDDGYNYTGDDRY